MKPWHKGALANHNGNTKENPYPEGTDQHAAWLDGWEESKFNGGWLGPNFLNEPPPHPFDKVEDI